MQKRKLIIFTVKINQKSLYAWRFSLDGSEPVKVVTLPTHVAAEEYYFFWFNQIEMVRVIVIKDVRD